MSNPLISIITAIYNKATFIEETITSVVDQSYSNWELIIIDDRSSDNSIQLVKEKFRDTRIIILENEDRKGANVCRNKGIEWAKGDFILFLDGDDVLLKNCLKERIEEMVKEPSLDFCVFSMGVFNEKIGDNVNKWVPRSKKPLIDFLQHNLPWSILQPIWKKDLLKRVNGFDEEFSRLQDVETAYTNTFFDSLKFKEIPEILDCYYRIGDNRRNLNTFEYNMTRVIGTLQFYSKFYQTAKEKGIHAKLMGTVYQTYLQCIFHTRNKKMSKDQFNILERELLNKKILHLGIIKSVIIKCSKVYNFYLPRVSGFNHLINKLITY